MWGEKKKNSHRSPQAIRMAVYDASQWGCAQLRPANETRTFGTIRPFSNIILFVHQPQTGPDEKQKGGFDVAVWVQTAGGDLEGGAIFF